MQTWLVHKRRPHLLLRQLGIAGAVAFQLLFAANVLAALIHPAFVAGLAYALLVLPKPWAIAIISHPAFAATLLSGYAATIVLGLIGLKRRRLLGHAWVLILTPLYWLLLSLAAWRALFQLLCDPQRWEKTEHGLAKTSRRTVRLTKHRRPKTAARDSASRRPGDIAAGQSPAQVIKTTGRPLTATRRDQANF